MGQGQLKCNRIKVFYTWLVPNQTVSARRLELTMASPLETVPLHN